jgi:hypothetical protein
MRQALRETDDNSNRQDTKNAKAKNKGELGVLCAFAFFAPLHSLRLCVRLVLSGITDTQAEDYLTPR